MAKTATAGELRGQTQAELKAKVTELKEELFTLRFQSATGQLESHGRLRAVRKDIARIYTVLQERTLGITDDEWHKLLHHTGKVPLDIQGSTMNATYEGVVEKFNRLYVRRDTSQMSERTRQAAQEPPVVAGT